MAISFPAELPAYPAPRSIAFGLEGGASLSESIYTRAAQVQVFSRERWLAQVSYSPIGSRTDDDRLQAARMRGHLASLNGVQGYFPLGPIDARIPTGDLRSVRNMLRWSQSFDNALWVKEGSGAAAPTVTANFIQGPAELDGGTAAERIVFPATGAGQYSQILQTVVGKPRNAGRQFTFSIYLKATVATTLQLLIDDGFPVSDRGQYTANVTTSWKRFYLGHTFGRTVNPGVVVAMRSPASQSAKTVYAYGAQLEEARPATAYQAEIRSGPTVNGASQTGSTLAVDGLTPATVPFRRGDYFQVGEYLHMVLSDVAPDEDGEANLDVTPRLRESPADGDFLIWRDPRGLFRMTRNDLLWQFDTNRTYGFEFEAAEYIPSVTV